MCQHITGHFWDESFWSITCTGTDNQTSTTKRQNIKYTNIINAIKVAVTYNTVCTQ